MQIKRTTPTKAKPAKRATSDSPAKPNSSLVLYAGYRVWESKRSPKWHGVKKMRYVFWRMTAGLTVSDAIQEIGWHQHEFWHLLDLKHHGPFREEYKRAQIVQSRSISDSVHTIAEARDVLSQRSLRDMRQLIKKTLRRAGRQKSTVALRAIIGRLSEDLSNSRKDLVARNKVQIDAAKWLAKTSNPAEFGDKSQLGIVPPPDGSPALGITISFVGPDGKVVPI